MTQQNSIGFEIKTVSNLIKRKVNNSVLKKELNSLNKATGMHGWIVNYLYNNRDQGDLFQRDIEARFSIRRSTATGLLKLMEKNGLLVRESVDYDARLKKLVLTEKAIAIHNKIDTYLIELEEQLKTGLTQQEIDTFMEIMAKIKKNVE